MNEQPRLSFQQFVDLLHLPPPASDQGSCFAFSLHKAGSTLLFNMLQDISPAARLAYVSIEDQRYALGYKTQELPTNVADLFEARGYLYGGFRFLQGFYAPVVRTSRKILLVRHPLDILTSLYFSMAISHTSPGRRGSMLDVFKRKRELASTMTCDEFACRNSKWLFSRFLGYRPILGDANLAVFRYEDVIYDKLMFLSRVGDHFGWNVPERSLAATAAKHDRIPGAEKPDQHIRQVHPNNHQKHLSADTIAALTAEFAPILAAFGYAPSESPAHIVLRDIPVPKWKPFLPQTR